MWQTIRSAIRKTTGQPCPSEAPRPVGGGCINEAWRLGEFFVKTNRPDALAMFEAEAAGLRELAEADAIKVPRPICHGTTKTCAFLVLEHLDLGHRGDEATIGRQLAALHRVLASDGQFGWHRDNTIGATPQVNTRCAGWADFFVVHRLDPQFQLAERRGRRFQGTESLRVAAHRHLAAHVTVPSLLHGDLWGGNASFDSDGNPVLFDPAVYFGDRETDLAFSRMFGGFGANFYAAYDEEFPLPDGWESRVELYNLYHLLNHFNLFGGGYGAQAEDQIRRLLAAI